jgi:serine/threonine-protein kinase
MGSGKYGGGIRRFLAAAGTFAAVAAAFIFVMLASGYFTMRMVQIGRRVDVPDVTGLTLAEAREAMVSLNLFVEVATEKHDARVEQGRILGQEPSAGAPIKRFRKVKVVTSLGPKVFTIPDLRGYLLRSALVTLEAEGLRPGRIAYAHSNLAQPDVVVSQDPPPEGESLGHSGVSLLVSKGAREPIYVMPALRGQKAGEVAGLLAEYGLRLGSVRRELAPWVPRGRVTGQYPEAGYPVSRGDTISVVVSN